MFCFDIQRNWRTWKFINSIFRPNKSQSWQSMVKEQTQENWTRHSVSKVEKYQIETDTKERFLKMAQE